MKCGGCSAAVKRMLLTKPGVANAAVNLLTETAAVTVRPPAGADPAAFAAEVADFVSSKVGRESAQCSVACCNIVPGSFAGVQWLDQSLQLPSIVDTSCWLCCTQGFPAKVRPPAQSAADADAAEARRAEEARTSLINLGVAWSLVLFCCVHHLGHLLHMAGRHDMAHGALMQLMASPAVSGALGAAALLGPGRQ